MPNESPIQRIIGLVGASYTSKCLKQPFKSIKQEIQFLLDERTGSLSERAKLMLRETDLGGEESLYEFCEELIR